MTPETKKITPQKAAALAKREGVSTKDMTEGQEVVTAEGVLLKEAKTYYLTTEPKPAAVARPETVADATDFIETTTTYLTKPEQTFVEPKREKQAKAPLIDKAIKARVTFTPRRADLGQETGLMKGGTRRRKGKLLKQALRRKTQGRMTQADIAILARHADCCRYTAAANTLRGF